MPPACCIAFVIQPNRYPRADKPIVLWSLRVTDHVRIRKVTIKIFVSFASRQSITAYSLKADISGCSHKLQSGGVRGDAARKNILSPNALKK